MKKSAGLWPGWEAVTGCRTRIPARETSEDQAEAYLEATFDKLRQEGHITDARIDSLELLPAAGEEASGGTAGEDPGPVLFRAAFSLRPLQPELSYWQDRGVDGEGWVRYELDRADLVFQEGLYEMGWFE